MKNNPGNQSSAKMKTMKQTLHILLIALSLTVFSIPRAFAQAPEERPVAKKILFIGDSMTGWLSERLGAYGTENGFEVATIVWDGSTITKWGKSPRLTSVINEQKPDAIFVSLGMNDLFEANPETRFGNSMDAIKGASGDIPIIWVGPPSWPGYNKGEIMNKWLAGRMGEGHYFNSFGLDIPRQSSKNPHPTRTGMISWMDMVVEWIKNDGAISLPGYEKPVKEQMSRGKTFIYKRMKESL